MDSQSDLNVLVRMMLGVIVHLGGGGGTGAIVALVGHNGKERKLFVSLP